MKFKSDIEVQAGLKDSSGAAGTSGQVLSSNGTTVSWINSGGGFANDVQNTVKAGVAINKGQAVYVTGADGTNIIVGLASNATEATSSKTLGLLNATVAINGFADVIQIGKLAGLDTSTAVVGDPVWLGSNGNLIYGLANKPYAPLHLVYIGVVTRVNANNGEIFINVQNGFELKEIHDVSAQTPSNNNGIFYNTSNGLWEAKSISAAGGIQGSGTTNYIPKFTGASAIGNSLIYDNGTNVGIGQSSPFNKLTVEYPSAVVGNTSADGVAFQTSNTGDYIQFLTNLGNYSSIQAGIRGSITGRNLLLNPSGGNVGIGTTSPAERLSIVGSTDYRTIFLERNLTANTAQRTGIVSKTYSGANNFGLIGGADISGTSADVTIGYTGSVGANQIILYTAPTYNGGQVERMRITSAGNVGIGTTTVPNTLSVGMASSTTGKGISLTSSAGIEYARFGVINSTVDNTSYIGSISNNNFAIYANNAERMRIATTGEVTINNLSGTGSRMVVADATGVLSTQTIPTGTVTGTGTSGQVAFWNGTSSITGESALFWDSTNDRLGIGGTASYGKLELTNSSFGTQTLSFSTPDGTQNPRALVQYITATGSQRVNFTSSYSSATSLANWTFENGNVGIGTTTPTQTKLVVDGGSTIASPIFAKSSLLSSGKYYGAVMAGYAFATNQSSGFGHVYDSTTIANSFAHITPYGSVEGSKFAVRVDGNVGIGTSSPVTALHILRNSSTVNPLTPTNTSSIIIQNTYGSTSNSGSALFFESDTGTNNLFAGVAGNMEGSTATGSWGHLTFGTKAAAADTTLTERMRITDTGRVGIGTLSPLTVLQAESANTAVDSVGNAFISTNNTLAADIGGQLTLGGLYNSSARYAFGGIAGRKENATTGNVAGYLTLMTTTSAGALSERMRIFSNGNVGIGTGSTNAGYKLNVNGDFLANTYAKSYTGNVNSDNYFEKVFPDAIAFTNGVANLAADIRLGNLSFWGYIEVEITATYSNQNSAGKLTKVFAVGTNPTNTIYTNESRVVDAMGTIPDNIAIGDMSWDATNTTYRIPISHIVSSGNNYTVKVRMFTHSSGAWAVFNVMTISGTYTLTALARQYVYYNSNLGIGTTTPNARLDVTNSSSNEIASFIGSSGAVPYKILNNVNVGEYWRGIFTGQNIIINATTGKPSLRTAGYTGSAIAYSADSSQGYLGFFTTTSTTANVDLSERMRITSGGNVLIGTTTDAGYKLDVAGTGRVTGSLTINSATTPFLHFHSTRTSGQSGYIKDDGNMVFQKTESGGGFRFLNSSSSVLLSIDAVGASAFSNNVTITPPSNQVALRVNHSGTNGAEGSKFNSAGSGTTYGSMTMLVDSCNYGTGIRIVTGLWSASQSAMQFYSGTTSVGSISCTTSATAYNTSSDYRLKENVVPMESPINRLKELNPCRFNFINNPDKTVDGFIAHEVQGVIPEAITGEKDELDYDGSPKYQGIDQSKIVPLLTAALQEAISKIEELENRLLILENK